MYLIQQTIQKGGFITDQLYVPRAVWEQTHAQIYAIEKKLTFFNDLKKEMRTLGIHKKKGTISKDYKVRAISPFNLYDHTCSKWRLCLYSCSKCRGRCSN